MKPASSPSKAKKAASRPKAQEDAQTVEALQLDQVFPCPFNRDAQRDIEPLLQSIKDYGQQQPIKVRPREAGGWEIVFGERRWQACKRAGLKTINATVETLTDAEAEELRVLENTQRQDPHALEEAEAWERLLALADSKGRPVHTPESIADLTGRKVGVVYNRLKLTSLAPELRKACYAGTLTTSGAFLIARSIPTELQAEAWNYMLKYAEEEASDDSDLDDAGHLRNAVIQQIIGERYSARLEHAPFSLKDKTLVPAAGSCQACPKRAGNQPMLFEEADPKDTCGDLPCFRGKFAAYVEREKQRVVAAGGRMATDEESRRIFNGSTHLPWNSEWVHLDATCYDDTKQRTYRQILGDHCPSALLAFNVQTKPFLLARKADVAAAFESAGVKTKHRELEESPAAPRPRTKTTSTHHDDPEAEDRDDLPPDHPDSGERRRNTDPQVAVFQGRVRAATVQRLIGAVVAAAEAASLDDNRFASLVLSTMFRGGYSLAASEAFHRRDLKIDKAKCERAGASSVYAHRETALAELATTLAPGQLRGLVLELAISRSGSYVGGTDYSDALTAAVTAYGIDPAPIEKATAEEFEARRAARAAGSKKSVAA